MRLYRTIVHQELSFYQEFSIIFNIYKFKLYRRIVFASRSLFTSMNLTLFYPYMNDSIYRVTPKSRYKISEFRDHCFYFLFKNKKKIFTELSKSHNVA